MKSFFSVLAALLVAAIISLCGRFGFIWWSEYSAWVNSKEACIRTIQDYHHRQTETRVPEDAELSQSVVRDTYIRLGRILSTKPLLPLNANEIFWKKAADKALSDEWEDRKARAIRTVADFDRDGNDRLATSYRVSFRRDLTQLLRDHGHMTPNEKALLEKTENEIVQLEDSENQAEREQEEVKFQRATGHPSTQAIMQRRVPLPTPRGEINIPQGATVDVLARDGTTVKVRYIGYTTTVPIEATDLATR